MDYGIVLTTTQNIEEAKKIAHYLIEKKIAACVNIQPQIVSVYRWKEQIVEDEECLLIIKIKKSCFDEVKTSIISLHSYELPEIIMIPIENGDEDYLNWINSNTTGKI